MSETTIDSLDIRLTASATQAVKSINLLEGALAGLGSTVIPVAMGLDKVADSLDRMIANKTGIESLSKSLGALAKSWTTLNSTTTKSSSQMGEAATKAKTMSDTLAKEWGIKGKENVAALRDELTKFYSSLGNEAALGKYINGIDHIIRETARLKKEVDDTASKVREFVSNTTIYVPEQVKSEWGDEFKRKIGILGIRNTTTDRSKGVDPETLIRDINEKFNPDAILGADNDTGLINLRDAAGDAASALDLVVRYLENARQESLTFKEAAKESSEPVERLETTLEELAVSMGTTLSGATQSYIEAMSRGQEITQNLSDSIASVNSNLENTETVVSPISNLLESLSALQGVDLPESLKNLEYVANSVGRLGGKYSSSAAENITNIGTALQGFHVEIPEYGDKLQNLAAGLSKLGGKKISDAFEILTRIQVAINNFQHVTIDPAVIDSIQRLGDGLYRFGLAKMDKAVTNIPALAQSLTQLISSLSTVPQVSENTIRLVTALGNLNVNGNQLNRALNNVNGGLRRYKGHALNARKASMSLAAAFGKMYANFFIFFRLAQRFKKDIDLASQLTEVQNVVDVTFTDMADKMNEFSKTAVDTLGMSELTAKQIGSKYQAMGKAMGISSDMAKSTNDFVQKATGGYADVAESMADISINLTRLAGDMASFYNMDYAEVAEKLQAIFTGQTRPMRAFGVDLTQASLKAFALANGLNADIKSMTQAEKTLLRYQYVMAQTTAAQGDFLRTQDTWANQTRIATERMNQLRIVLGKIAIYTFKPLVQSFNKAMAQIIKGAEGLLNALGKIFGWQVEWSEAGVLQDEEEDSEGIADNMGDAADNAKKFKNFLLGIDELNLLPDNSDKDKNGSGSGLGGLAGGLADLGKYEITPIEGAFESLYDTLYKLGKRIAEVEKELLKGIDWDKAYKNARKFGKGFASFLNGYLSDIELFYHKGRTLANGINTVAHAIDAFFREFDGRQLGLDRGMEINGFTSNLDWGLIKSASYEMAHDIAEYINGIIEGTNWYDVGRTLIEGFNTAVLFCSTIINEVEWAKLGSAIGDGINGLLENWDEDETARAIRGLIQGALDLVNNLLTSTDFALLGTKIGNFIAELDLSRFAEPVADLLLNLLKAAFDTLGTMALEAPLETALITAFAGAKFLGVGSTIGGLLTSSIKNNLTTGVGGLATDQTILSKAATVGTAIAGSVVAAFVGYGLGDKLGEHLSEVEGSIIYGDKMWYGKSMGENAKEIAENKDFISSAMKEMVTDLFGVRNELSDTDSAFKAFSKDVSAEAAEMLLDMDGDFAEFEGKTEDILKTFGTSWGQIKDNLRMGKVELNTEDFERLQQMLVQSGGSLSEIKPLINELKQAQEEYYNGFADYYEKEGSLFNTREQAYKQYTKMHEAVDEYIKTHERERLALQSGASTYEEVYERIPKAAERSNKRVEESAAKTFKVFDALIDTTTGTMERTVLNSKGVLDKEGKQTAEAVESSSRRIEKAAVKSGGSLKITMQAMADLKDQSSLAMAGMSGLSDKFEDAAQSASGIKDIETKFTSLNTAIIPVKVGFADFATQTQANMLNTTAVFGQSFTNIIKYGNQAITWLKSSFVPYFTAAYWTNITASIPNAFANAFNQAITIMQNMWKQFATWANANMKINANVTKGANGVKVQANVPKYSTGGFPEDGFFFANHSEMVGTFSNGKSAVANNEQIVEGIKQGVYEAVSAAMQGGSQGVTVELVGDASDIFTAVVKENNRTIMRTGTSPIRN